MDMGLITKLLKPKWAAISLGLLCTAFILLLQIVNVPIVSPLIKELNNRIYDQIINLSLRHQPQNPRIVIIDIDEKSVQKEGRWPWPRDKMAELITKLKQAGIVTIGLDIVMSEAEINYALGLKNKLARLNTTPTQTENQFILSLDKIAPEVDNDQAFIKTLLDHNIVLGYLFQNDPSIKKGTLPAVINIGTPNIDLHAALFQFKGYNGVLTSFINASTKGGFVSNIPDRDGTVRHAIMLAQYDNKVYASFPLAIAMNYLLANNVSIVSKDNEMTGLTLDGLFIPTNSQSQVLVPYWDSIGNLEYYSATDILQNKIDPKELQGSIAIVGSSMTLLADLHETPVAQSFPGVEIVGNVVKGIVAQDITKPFNWNSPIGLLYFALLGIFFALLFPTFGLFGKLVIIIISLAGIPALTAYMFAYKNSYISSGFLLTLIVFQAVANYIYDFIMERRQKRKISQLFGQYVPQDYVRELIESPQNYNMEGLTRNMTVQFTDIRNFTDTCENLDASGVKHLLNAFFTPITEIIFSQRGTIDKYVGDMIVAFWGAPLEDNEHAYHAIVTSLLMFKNLPEINQGLQSQGLPLVNIGIGLATGQMNVGDMGSEFRRAYTVLGDTVNLASRLQDLTKFYQVNILVNDITRSNQDGFVWKAIDKVAVKGRKTALTIYQPLGIVTEASPELLTELNHYKVALELYYNQHWIAAEKEFSALCTSYPHIYLYTMYLDRIKEFKENPPAEDWDGVFIHTHK